MRDPEELLRSLPPESPPPEIVMAAIRVFRYRAIAAIALACALVLSAFVVKGQIDEDSRLLERIGEIRYTTGGVVAVNQLRDVNGVKVMLWEVVVDESDTTYVHALAWDARGRDFSIAISEPSADGRPATLGSVEGFGGGANRTHAEVWQEIRVPSTAELRTLTFNVEVQAKDEEELSGSIPFEIDL